MSKQKKIILIALAIFILVFIVLSIFVVSSSQKTSQAPTQEPERGGRPITTFVDPSKALSSSFTIDYYQAIKYAMADFIKTQHGNQYDTVTISDIKVPVRDGDTTTFKAKIPSLKQTYTIYIKIPLDVNGQPTFSIPAINYSSPLNLQTGS